MEIDLRDHLGKDPKDTDVDPSEFEYFNRKREKIDVSREIRNELEGRSEGGIGVKGLKGQLQIPLQYRGRNISNLMNIWMAATTLPPSRNIEGKIDIRLKPIIDLVWWRYAQKPPEADYIEMDYSPSPRPKTKNALCALSGGFDSTAVMVSMIEAGLNVTAFTVEGLNRGAYNSAEMEASRAICDKLGVKLITHRVVNSIECDHLENPIKNLIFYNMMMGEAERLKAPFLGMGIFMDDTIRGAYCPSDSYEVIGMFRDYLAKLYYPHSLFIGRRKDEAECILDKHGLTTEVRSCITPVRYFSQRRAAMKKKIPGLDVKKWKNSCLGYCYKCSEQILRGLDFGTRSYGDEETNKAIYKHCLEYAAKYILKNEAEGIDTQLYMKDSKWARQYLKDNGLEL